MATTETEACLPIDFQWRIAIFATHFLWPRPHVQALYSDLLLILSSQYQYVNPLPLPLPLIITLSQGFIQRGGGLGSPPPEKWVWLGKLVFPQQKKIMYETLVHHTHSLPLPLPNHPPSLTYKRILSVKVRPSILTVYTILIRSDQATSAS
jgi:hypothetical protein